MALDFLGNHWAVPEEILIIELNPTLSVLAIVYATGYVALYPKMVGGRCNGIPAKNNGKKIMLVIALAWRPDGLVLALAYEDFCVQLYNLHGTCIKIIKQAQPAILLNWTHCNESTNPFNVDYNEYYMRTFFIADTPLSNFANQGPVHNDFKKLNLQKDLNILAVGMEDGNIFLYAFGVTLIGCIDMNSIAEYGLSAKIASFAFSKNFRIFTVTFQKLEEGKLFYLNGSYNVYLLSNKTEEIKLFSLKYGQISSAIACLSGKIIKINELLLIMSKQIDAKFLSHGSQNKVDPVIVTRFVKMLSDNPSDVYQSFIKSFNLTEASEFYNFIRKSLQNILNLVPSQLHFYSTSIHSYLLELKEIVMFEERFVALGIDINSINTAIMAADNLLLKIKEVEHVSLRSCSAMYLFFKGLNLSLEQSNLQFLPLSVKTLSPSVLHQARTFVLESLDIRFDSENSQLKHFDHYLKTEDLHPASAIADPGMQSLEEDPAMTASGVIFRQIPDTSLITFCNDLIRATHPSILKIKMCFKMHQLQGTGVIFPQPYLSNATHFGCNERYCTYITFIDNSPPCSRFSLVSQSNVVEVVTVSFTNFQNQSLTSKSNKNYKVIDVKFLNMDFLIVLLLEDGFPETNRSVLLQLSMVPLVKELDSIFAFKLNPYLDGLLLMENSRCRQLENMRASYMAVSNTHKVVCVYSESQKEFRFIDL